MSSTGASPAPKSPPAPSANTTATLAVTLPPPATSTTTTPPAAISPPAPVAHAPGTSPQAPVAHAPGTSPQAPVTPPSPPSSTLSPPPVSTSPPPPSTTPSPPLWSSPSPPSGRNQPPSSGRSPPAPMGGNPPTSHSSNGAGGCRCVSTPAVFGIAVAVVAVLLAIFGLILTFCRKKKRNHDPFDYYGPPSPGTTYGFPKSTFSYGILSSATDGFSDANLLGQGG